MHCYEIDASIWRSVILTCTQDGVKTDLEWGCNRSRVFFLLLHIIVGDGVLSQVWDGTLATCACATHVSSQRFDVNRIRKRWRISRVIMYKAVYHGLCMAMLVLDSFGAQFLTGFARTTPFPADGRHQGQHSKSKVPCSWGKRPPVKQCGLGAWKEWSPQWCPCMGSTGNVSGIRIKCIYR